MGCGEVVSSSLFDILVLYRVFSRAALYLVTHSVDEQGLVKAGCHYCPSNWSLAECGVTSETELIIQLAASKETTPPVTQRSK